MFNYCCGNASPLADTGECFCMQNQANGQSWILSPDKQTCVLGTETEGTRDPNPNTGASLVTVTLTEGGTTTVTTTMTATATAITPA